MYVCIYCLAEMLSPVDGQCWLEAMFLSCSQGGQSMLHNHPQFGRHARPAKGETVTKTK